MVQTTLARHFPELAYFGPAHQRQLQQAQGGALDFRGFIGGLGVF